MGGTWYSGKYLVRLVGPRGGGMGQYTGKWLTQEDPESYEPIVVRAQLRESLEGLLAEFREPLGAAGFPGTVLRRATKDVVKHVFSLRARPPFRVVQVALGEVPVWRIPEDFDEYGAGFGPGELWLGVDGTIYQDGDGELHEWGGAEEDLLGRMLLFIERMLRAELPRLAPLETIAFLDEIFTAAPRPVLETAEQHRMRERELRCDDPVEAFNVVGSTSSNGSAEAVEGRHAQLRYLWLSWLRLVTATGAEPSTAQPELFADHPPYLPGGAATAAEIAMVLRELLADGSAEWIEVVWPGNRPADEFYGDLEDAPALWPSADQYRELEHDGDDAFWRVVLTPQGVVEADALESCVSSAARAAALRTIVLRWIGRHAKEPHTVSLGEFHQDSDALVDGIAVTGPDLYRTARWLATRNYATASVTALPGAPVQVGLTRRGLVCVEQFRGDVVAMEEAEYRRTGSGSRYVITGGEFHGVQFAAGDIENNHSTVAGAVSGGGAPIEQALSSIRQAIQEDVVLSEDERADLLDGVEYLADAARQPAEKRNRGMIKSALSALAMAAATGTELGKALNAWDEVFRTLIP